MNEKATRLLRRIVPIVLAAYFVLAFKWYPGWVDSRFSFQEPLRVVFYGFSHDWPNPGYIVRVSRPVWPVVLFPVFGLAAWAFFRFWALPAAGYVGRATVRAFRPEGDWLQWVSRLMVLIVLVNLAFVPLTRAGCRRLGTVHDIVAYGLFPLSVCSWLVYLGSVFLVRAGCLFINLSCVPRGGLPGSPCPHPPFSAYQYEGLGTEVARFMIVLLALILLTSWVTPVLTRYRRSSIAVLVLLCLSLLVFVCIGALSPGTLR